MNLTASRVLLHMMMGIVAILLVFIVARYLNPVVTSDSLSPHGIGQSGWPLSFSASFWDESVNTPYQARRFSIGYCALNVAGFYLLLASLEYAFRRILDASIQDVRQKAKVDTVRIYASYILFAVCIAAVLCRLTVGYFSVPSIETGVASQSAQTNL